MNKYSSRIQKTPDPPRTKASIWLYLPFIIAAILIGIVWANRDHVIQINPAMIEPSKVTVESPISRELTLFFASSSGQGWAPEQRKIQASETERQEIRKCLEEMLKGPQRGGRRILDKNLAISGVYIDKNGMVIIDFSNQGTPVNVGGISSEIAAIQSLIKTIQTNFPTIKSVEFLINGQESETFAGHVNISKPFFLL